MTNQPENDCACHDQCHHHKDQRDRQHRLAESSHLDFGVLDGIALGFEVVHQTRPDLAPDRRFFLADDRNGRGLIATCKRHDLGVEWNLLLAQCSHFLQDLQVGRICSREFQSFLDWLF